MKKYKIRQLREHHQARELGKRRLARKGMFINAVGNHVLLTDVQDTVGNMRMPQRIRVLQDLLTHPLWVQDPEAIFLANGENWWLSEGNNFRLSLEQPHATIHNVTNRRMRNWLKPETVDYRPHPTIVNIRLPDLFDRKVLYWLQAQAASQWFGYGRYQDEGDFRKGDVWIDNVSHVWRVIGGDRNGFRERLQLSLMKWFLTAVGATDKRTGRTFDSHIVTDIETDGNSFGMWLHLNPRWMNKNNHGRRGGTFYVDQFYRFRHAFPARLYEILYRQAALPWIVRLDVFYDRMGMLPAPQFSKLVERINWALEEIERVTCGQPAEGYENFPGAMIPGKLTVRETKNGVVLIEISPSKIFRPSTDNVTKNSEWVDKLGPRMRSKKEGANGERSGTK